jgi:probable phosphoglycerate mutase
MLPRIYLIRHGETEWSIASRHTGRSDLPLTPQGEEQARRLAPILAQIDFSLVLCSPRQRARRTCELAGFLQRAEIAEDIAEWNYGEAEGLTRTEVRAKHPNWNIFRDGAPGGESPDEIYARADKVVRRLRALNANALLFSHGHFLRILGARWVGWPVATAAPLFLSPASISVLGFEHENPDEPVLRQWNCVPEAEIR